MELAIGPPAPTPPAATPAHVTLHGRYTSVIPMNSAHAPALLKHLGGEENEHRWTYLFDHGFPDEKSCEERVGRWIASTDPLFFSVLTGPASNPNAEPAGVVSYLNIVPSHLRIEIGSVILGGELKQTRQATEAFYLMIRNAFENLGYHRVEWKANQLNAPSLSAAKRLGFVYEGTFRKHIVTKGRWRDTAWFSITSDEWPAVKRGFETWLDEKNFDHAGKQRRKLQECRGSP